MGVRKPRQRGVSRNQSLDPLGHRRRWRNRIDANFLRGIGDSQRTGDRSDAALCRGIAIAPGDPHQRDIRAHVDHRTAAGLHEFRYAEPAAEKCAVKVELDRAPEFIERRIDCSVVLRSRTAGIVVEHVEAAKLVDNGADRGLQAVGVRHVGAERYLFISSEVRGFLTGLWINLGNGDFRAFTSEKDCGGAADPTAGAGDEGYFACEPWHRTLLPGCKIRRQSARTAPPIISPSSTTQREPAGMFVLTRR